MKHAITANFAVMAFVGFCIYITGNVLFALLLPLLVIPLPYDYEFARQQSQNPDDEEGSEHPPIGFVNFEQEKK